VSRSCGHLIACAARARKDGIHASDQAAASGELPRDAVGLVHVETSIREAQSSRVSTNNGIRRVVSAWNSAREGDAAISFGHSLARAVPSSSSASAVNVSVPTSTSIERAP
jgi:hypothetical protein